MALRRVTTPRTFFKAVTPNLKGSMDTVSGTGGSTSAGGFNFTPEQHAAGFQQANTVGRQYPEFAEAPRSYVSEHPIFGSDAGASYRFDESFGMLGSLIGPHARQALNTPITGRTPSLTVNYYDAKAGQAVDASADTLRGYSINASIDWALGEKQATFGTPEYFRKAYRDAQVGDPALIAYGAELQLRQATPETRKAWYDSNNASYEDSTGTKVKYKTPTLSASSAINGGYQNRNVSISSGVEEVRSGMHDMVPYMSSSAAAAHTAVYRQNEQYLGTGTGDFRGPRISVSARATTNTVRGAYEPDQSYSSFGRASLSYPTTSGGYRLRF
jgi:hypothetical protein